MKKLIFISLLLIHFSQLANAQGFFSRSYGGAGDDYGRAVIECSTGGYLMVGSTNSFWDSSTDIYLLRVDEFGDYLWGRNIGTENHIEWGMDLVESSDGSFYISGITNNNASNNYDGMLVKTDADGHVIWTKKYGGDGWDFIENMTINTDDEIILAGQISQGDDQNGWLIKTDAEGEIVWEQFFEGTGVVKLTGVDYCSDGNIVFTGFNDYQLLNQSTQISGSIAEDGVVNWVTSFAEFGNLATKSCICSSSNKILSSATMNTDSLSKNQFSTIDATSGDVLWSRFSIYDTESNGGAIGELVNGKLLLAISIEGFGFAEFDAATYVLNPNTGYLISPDYTELFGGLGIDKLNGIIPTTDGGYAAVGETTSFGNNSQIFFVKVTAEGESTFENQDFLDIATSISDAENEINVQLWPNPSQDKINFMSPDQTEIFWNYEIVNSQGAIQKQGRVETKSGNAQIDIATLNNGIYILRAFDNQQKHFSQKFVKTN